MIDFLINTPNHKRWYLPNRDYALNSVIFGDEVLLSVIYLPDMRTRERLVLKLTNENWEHLSDMFHTLAVKKYPKPLRHRDSERRAELFRSRHRDSQ